MGKPGFLRQAFETLRIAAILLVLIVGKPASVRSILVDGAYAKEKFVSGVCRKGYEVVSRLRCDTNLRFLFQGEPPKRGGRPRKFDGKVNLAESPAL